MTANDMKYNDDFYGMTVQAKGNGANQPVTGCFAPVHDVLHKRP